MSIHRSTLPLAILIIIIILLPLVNAITKERSIINCPYCHKEIELGAHSQLGDKRYACQVCHDEYRMKPHMLNGTFVTNATVQELCRSCHREKYADWSLGIHGKYGLNVTTTGIIQRCTICHNPHIPDLPDISPAPPPHPPERSTANLAVWFPPAIAILAGSIFATVHLTRRSWGG